MTDPKTRPAAGQHWDPAAYAANAGFVPALGAPVLALLAPQRGERILDLGCGDGVLTAKLVEAGAEVTGLEPDPRLAEAARGRGIAVIEQDAHSPFGEGVYDAVFSNAALHWMRDPPVVLGNIARALRPGGRVVAEQGGFGNVAAICTALQAALEAGGHPLPASFPWDFPSPTLQRQRLRAAGLEPGEVALIPRPTPLPTGMAGWLETFSAPFLGGLDREAAAAVRADTVRRLGGLNDPAEGWIADYVRLRFTAFRPG